MCLKDMCYGIDGYFLLFRIDIVLVMYLIKFEMVGKNMFGVMDLEGKYLFVDIV